MANRPRIGVVGATGAVGTITLELLRERGYENVRLFAFGVGDDVDAILDGLRRYGATSNGLIPWRERPDAFRKGVLARIPPLPRSETNP